MTDIVLPKISCINESNLVVDDNMFNVAPMFGLVRNHILNALMQEANAMQEIITTSIMRKSQSEGMIKMLNLQAAGASSSQVSILNNEKYAMALGEDEDMSSANENNGFEYETASDKD